jgi:hypothetical protein
MVPDQATSGSVVPRSGFLLEARRRILYTTPTFGLTIQAMRIEAPHSISAPPGRRYNGIVRNDSGTTQEGNGRPSGERISQGVAVIESRIEGSVIESVIETTV